MNNRTLRPARGLALLIFCAWPLCQSISANATVLSHSDVEHVFGLDKEIGQLALDSSSAAQGALGTKSGDCLGKIANQLEEMARILNEIGVLTDISTQMQLSADEATVNQNLASFIIPFSRERAALVT